MTAEIGFSISLTDKLLYILLNNNNFFPISRKEPDNTGFKALKENLMNSPALEHFNDQIPSFLFIFVKKGMPLGFSPQNTRTTKDTLDSHRDNLPCLRAILTTAILVKTTKNIIVGSPLTILYHMQLKAFLNSHTHHFSVSCLTSCEVLLLTAPHIMLLHCSNLDPAVILPYITGKVSQDCFKADRSILTRCYDLQEISLAYCWLHLVHWWFLFKRWQWQI